jgi:uncharacterized repeat protein (TIGR03803 family)
MLRPPQELERRLESIWSAANTVAVLLIAFILVFAGTYPAQAQTFRVLHDFQGKSDGEVPYGTLAIDGGGNLYGTTWSGGDYQNGVVFQLTPHGANWDFRTLYSFQGGNDGANPASGVTVAPDGTLYGTTDWGGGGRQELCGGIGCGTVFEIAPSGGSWHESIIYRFGGLEDGAGPIGVLVRDQAGNLYGTAPYGGSANEGVVFELVPSDRGWTETVLVNFDDKTSALPGGTPNSGVIFDQQGNLYGVTPSDLNGDCGTVFQLSRSASGWARTTLYNFNGEHNGCNPQGGLLFDQQGNLYGTTMNTWPWGGEGTAFQIAPDSGTPKTIWTSQKGFEYGGAGPTASMVMDRAGNLYGTSYGGGAYGLGLIFKLTPSNGGWILTSLHDFTGGGDGGLLQAGLVFDANGNLYGATSFGGSFGGGTVFEITP